MLSKFKVITLYYDGDCPICRMYSAFNRLKGLAETVQLINMRDLTEDEIISLKVSGVNPSDGVIVKGIDAQGGKVLYQKAEALTLLAYLNKSRDGFSLLNRVFRNDKLAFRLYPILFKARGLLLKLLKINPDVGSKF